MARKKPEAEEDTQEYEEPEAVEAEPEPEPEAPRQPLSQNSDIDRYLRRARKEIT